MPERLHRLVQWRAPRSGRVGESVFAVIIIRRSCVCRQRSVLRRNERNFDDARDPREHEGISKNRMYLYVRASDCECMQDTRTPTRVEIIMA